MKVGPSQIEAHYRRPRRRQWHPTPVLLPGGSHGRRSLAGYSTWDHKESDMTEGLHFYFSLSCIGEGNGNPFQCSCLANTRDGGAWWAAVSGVPQSRTQLKWLSSSSRYFQCICFLLKVVRVGSVFSTTNKTEAFLHFMCWYVKLFAIS